VIRRIRGTFDALGGLQAMLAALDTSPELQVTSLRSTYSQGNRLRAELKREAAQQSRRTADGLASAYGTRIIGLYTISDVAPDFAYGVRAGVWDTRENDDRPAFVTGIPAIHRRQRDRRRQRHRDGKPAGRHHYL